jgi:hypothetical protein
MERNMKYEIIPHLGQSKEEDNYYIAQVTMNYSHTGVFDWRTTRYRSYARVFIPQGSELISTSGSMRWDRTTDPGKIDSGIENGKQWFGTFIAIEPGKSGQLVFEYRLPKRITDQITNGSYNLIVQKQLGSIAHGLTLDLNFDKTIRSAKPAELESEWGDPVYRFETDLRLDRSFEVGI